MLFLYKTISSCCLWCFFLTPPIILILRLWKRNWFDGWRKWVVAALLPPLGWGLIICSLYMYHNYKWGLLAPYNDFREMPPDVLAVAQGGPNGAAYAFAIIFGLLYMPVYFGLWLIPYSITIGGLTIWRKLNKGWRELLKTDIKL